MAEPFIVTVYDVKLSALFSAMGEVGKPMTRLQREVFAAAVAEAPSRSGELKAAHVNRGSRKAGPYRTRGFIENRSRHAGYVHEGTNGPIFPVRHQNLHLKPGNGHGFKSKRWVSGQRANPWMTRAARTVLSRHGI